jgi:hypothetical protein
MDWFQWATCTLTLQVNALPLCTTAKQSAKERRDKRPRLMESRATASTSPPPIFSSASLLRTLTRCYYDTLLGQDYVKVEWRKFMQFAWFVFVLFLLL